MKRNILILLLAVSLLLTLSACGCKHETWNDADCTTPKTCAECGEAEGAPLGHSWLAATCEAAKTCEVCGETEGDVGGHSWIDVTCEAPKTCEVCGLTEGEALGHSWVDATTEAPKTCTTCAATEGERIITDARFTTASTLALQGTWSGEFTLNGEMLDIEDFPGEFTCVIILQLNNDGSCNIAMDESSKDSFAAVMEEYLVDALYAELAAAGLNEAAADAAMVETYGVTVTEYAAAAVAEMDWDEVFAEAVSEGVYYVDGSQLYMGDSWEDELTPSEFVLEGDTLTIADLSEDLGIELVMTRVVEE